MNARANIGMFIVLPIAGFFLGLAIPERINPLHATSPKAPDAVRPVEVIIPECEIKYRKECADLSYKATQGDLQTALVLFNRYTYRERDYQKAYYWAVIAERLGYDTKFGSLASGSSFHR